MSPEQLKQFSDRLNLRFANVFRERVSGSKYLYSVKYMLFPPENRNDAKKEVPCTMVGNNTIHSQSMKRKYLRKVSKCKSL